jgi:nucleotide-binding universal stress UspA family protein
MKAYKHILVPTDGSALSLKAAKQAASLAKDLDAKVTAVYVTRPWTPPLSEESAVVASFDYTEAVYRKRQEGIADRALAKVAKAAGTKVKCEKLRVDAFQAWEGIVKAAKDSKADLIVMASHGRGALGGLVLGSETTKVLSHSKTPVLVCR